MSSIADLERRSAGLERLGLVHPSGVPTLRGRIVSFFRKAMAWQSLLRWKMKAIRWTS
jgi:hypothetical protein